MKNLISYVIQDEKGHKHFSEILNFKNPPYYFTSNPSMPNVMDWAEKKKNELKKGEDLIIINVFKL